VLFNVKTGQYLGKIFIPSHMERSKGKDDNHCMYEPTGLNLFIFDEDRLIAVHDYERSFPAVLDIYKFWWNDNRRTLLKSSDLSTKEKLEIRSAKDWTNYQEEETDK
jgi:hypothetical protein